MGRGVIPGGHRSLVTKARGAHCPGPTWWSSSARRSTSGSATASSAARTRPRRRVRAGRPHRRLPRPGLRPRRAGRLGRRRPHHRPRRPADRDRARRQARLARRGPTSSPTRCGPPPRATPSCSPRRPTRSIPARIYGELVPRLADDSVVIGDGGDFVSFAGKYVEPKRPGGWLDPGPYGCLGAGLGAAIAARIARPSAQVTLLLGDGAAGFSLMDVDTLVRHDLPVVMVMGNNSAWGLEKGPMQMLYGYDVIADLAPRTPYDDVVKALGGDGETVTRPDADRPGARPRLRLRRPLPRQRDHRRRGRPTRAARSASEDVRGAARIRPRSTGTPVSVCVPAYAAVPHGAADPYVERLRDVCHGRPGAEVWVAVEGDRLLGNVTYCPPGSRLPRGGARRRGRVPDARRRPDGPGCSAPAPRSPRSARTARGSTAPSAWRSRRSPDDRRPPGLRTGSATSAIPRATGRRCPGWSCRVQQGVLTSAARAPWSGPRRRRSRPWRPGGRTPGRPTSSASTTAARSRRRRRWPTPPIRSW